MLTIIILTRLTDGRVVVTCAPEPAVFVVQVTPSGPPGGVFIIQRRRTAVQEQIRIALPSKGRMEEETLNFLAGCGLRVNKTNPRQYTATLPALPGVLVLFQRARDIPVSVAAGDVDLGITGYDALAETLNEMPDSVIVIHEALG
jgi:hypothetical protein